MRPTKVGDFVAFNHRIRSADGGILSLERGIVVGFGEDKRTANVVWDDGTPGVYWVKDLARTVGQIGRAVRDRGYRPVPAPHRPAIAAIPRRKTA